MRPRSARVGFTLVEMLTALVLTGMVALLAHQLLSVCVASVRQLDEARRAEDLEQNAARWLGSAFLSLDVGGQGGFEGLQNRVTFTAWLLRPEGWMRPARITLAANRGRLEVTGLPEGGLVLADSVSRLDLDYLLEPGGDVRWVRVWISPLSAPVALRLRIDRRMDQSAWTDTLLLLIKERG
jgi:type II secretory pathway pseudopilin PulG